MIREHLQRLRERSYADETALLIEDILDRWQRDRDEADRRLNRLTESLQILDSRLLSIENSRVFRILQRISGEFRAIRTKSRRYVRPRTSEDGLRLEYQLWLERQAAKPSTWYRDAIGKFLLRPRFSLLLHVSQPDRDQLLVAVESVMGQSYPDWELCICDDASPDPWIAQQFQALSATDSRVVYVRSQEVMGAASSLNRAGMLGGGDYVALLGQHDALAPHALFHVAEALQAEPQDVIYTDEDKLGPHGRERPSFKPGWSFDLLASTMYLGSSIFVSRTRMDQAGWFRKDFGDAHLFDLVLRLADERATFYHLPRVLLSSGAKPSSSQDASHALQAAIQRRGWHAGISESSEGELTLRRKLQGTPLASIVICSRNAKLLRSCLKSIDSQTAYPVREIVVVQHKTGDDAAMEKLLARSRCVRVAHAGPFDFATMNNRGAQAANGEVLVFFNDDVEPLAADWLKELLAQVQRAEVGIVGAKLLYPNGAIQHSGIALGLMDGAGHPNRGTFGEGFWPWSNRTRNVAAVTGACMAVRRSVFEELGGFDPCFPVNYNDVDLCLRARRAGYEVICETSAVLRHQESRTRAQGVSWPEREIFYQRWGKLIDQGDPYYSPHLTRSKEDCSLRDG